MMAMHDHCSSGSREPSNRPIPTIDDLKRIAQSVGAVVIQRRPHADKYSALNCHVAKSSTRPLMPGLPVDLLGVTERGALIELLTSARDGDLLTADEEGVLCRAKGCVCSGLCAVH